MSRLRSTYRWIKSDEPTWMVQAVPRRPARTPDAYRLAAALVLRPFADAYEKLFQVDQCGRAYRFTADELERPPRVWTLVERNRFNKWATGTLNGLLGRSLIERLEESRHVTSGYFGGPSGGLARLFNVRTGESFCRFLDGLHFVLEEVGDRLPPAGQNVDHLHKSLDRTAASALREVYGSPLDTAEKWSPTKVNYRWHPRRLPSAWCTDTVMSLTRQMWDANDFSAMPILADALQDAGCNREDVLTHCRDTELTHGRGCWVLDAILG